MFSICSHYIIDSHVHFWPASAANSESHAWMTPPDMPLARKFEMEEYVEAFAGSVNLKSGHPALASEQKQVVKVKGQGRSKLLGLIYIETDRRLLSPHTASELGDTPPYPSRWTHPLAEIAYLRSLIEAELSSRIPPTPRLLGLVPWAPIDEGSAALEKYMTLARSVAGEETWARIVGWRFLVQGLRSEGPFGDVVGSEKWLDGLRWLGRQGRLWRGCGDAASGEAGKKSRGFTFDVGVDQHGAGTWQLEGFVACIENVRALEDEDSDRDVSQVARTVFVLNHFCKPDFHSSSISSTSFEAWHAALARLATQPYVYLKLSGFFTEVDSPLLVSDTATSTTKTTATFDVALKYVKAAFKLFGARRIMFGSDWPVCGVGKGTNFGHRPSSDVGTERADGHERRQGEDGNPQDEREIASGTAWTEWHDVVERLLEACALDEEEKEWVWWKTAAEAYGVEFDCWS